MISLNSLQLSRRGRVLLKNATVKIHRSQHVGLVGANGCGKSSLFALLLDQLQPDGGDISIDPGRGIAHMAQEVSLLDRKAVDYVLDGDAQLRAIESDIAKAEKTEDHAALAELHEKLLQADGYTARPRAERILHGLGFEHRQLEQDVKVFSGGWRMRLNLARALMTPSDILLLDEPTNHLDIDAIIWLETYLQRYPGLIIVIAHDRDFLDSVTDSILHVEHSELHFYRGNYTAFEKTRSERLAQQAAAFEKQQKQRLHMEKFVERFRAKASKAKQAQSRLKALAKLELSAPALANSPFHFTFPEPDKISTPLLALDEAAMGYTKTVTLKGSVVLQPGCRIGLLGQNGAGKSTLIKTLAGELPLLAGERICGEHLSIGYFAQHQLEKLDGQASPLLCLQRVSPDEREQTLRSFLGGFGFSGDRAVDNINGFSGGEKARLALALLVWKKPNLLLLDEPTNHLDLDMRNALTLALQTYTGAVVLVSHDRNLLRSSSDELMLVANGSVQQYDDDLESYVRWINQQKQSDERVNTDLSNVQTRKERKRLEAKQRELLRPIRQKIASIEERLDHHQCRLEEVESALSDPALYEGTNGTQLQDLLQQQSDHKKTVKYLEEEWLEAEELLEQSRQTSS